MTGMHVGRAWVGHVIEDACPCPKAPCGLAAPTADPPFCSEHNPNSAYADKTMRQMHGSDQCPAGERS